MTTQAGKADEIFWRALEISSADERARFLAEACGGAAPLRAEVDELLAAYPKVERFLEKPAAEVGVTIGRPAISERPGTVIGPYKLLEQIGEGGMGTVFVAQQSEPLKRLVALKIIKAGMDSRQVIARFEAERQALALMDHPNIAKVLDAGTTAAGRPYFVIELVKGVPITQYCDQHHLPPKQRLELFVPVCQAIQHAHQKGIIHRDLKPSNVLVALYDDRPAPKVIDFGVAKATGQQLTEQTLHTGFGTVVGTLEYMSPEQATFNQLDIDTRSDVYSLGILLYELLAGSPPFTRKELERAGKMDMLRVIREEEPSKPSTRLSSSDALPTLSANRGTEPAKLARLVRGELDWIVMKALEKDRSRRYETASGLAMDVERYLADEPVLACPPSAWYRFGKFAKRNRREVLIAGAGAVVVMMGVVGLAVSRALIAREQRATVDALAAKTIALQAETRAKDDLRSEVYFQRITVAHRELSTDNLAAALRALQECPGDLRGWEWHYLMRLCKVEPLVIRDKAEVNGVAFSPDPEGERIASAGKDGKVKIWNSKTGKVIRTFPAHDKSVFSVAFHPDGTHLASVGADRRVKVWDLTADPAVKVFNGPCDALFREFGEAYTVAFSPDGRQLAAGSDGSVKVWDWKKNRPEDTEHDFPGHKKIAISVAFSRDGKRLASASTGEDVYLWDPQAEGPPLRTFPAHQHPVSALAFSPDGGWLAEANYDRSVKLWNTATGELGRSLPHSGNVECVAFSPPDGRRLASAGEDKTVRIWDATRLDEKQEPREVLGLRGHTGRCGCVAFSANGHRLASASHDGTIRVWDATPLRGDEGQEILTFAKHTDEIRGVAFSPDSDGQTIASVGQDTRVMIWNAQTGRLNIDFSGHTVIVFCVAWHPNGELIATAGNGPVKVWDARDGRNVFTLPQSSQTYAVAFSPDGRYLVTGGGTGAVQVWNAGNDQPVCTLGSHDREIRGLVFSKGGEHLASSSSDGIVKLWDAKRLDQKQEVRHALRTRVPGPSLNVAFSPDGQRLATGGEENTVIIWDVQTAEELQTLRGHSGEVYALAFSPNENGRWIATAGEDSTVKVWDSHSGTLVRSFRGHTGLVSSLAFSQGGSRLVSGSRDKTVKVWDVSQLETVPDR